MVNIKKWFILLTLLLSSLQLQPAFAESPFLWRIDPAIPGGRPSWLFGTIHSAHPQLNKLPPAVMDSFNRADAYYGELEMNPSTLAAATSSFMISDGRTLLEILSPARQQRINQVLSTLHPSLSIAAFSRLKLWALTATLSLLEDQLAFGTQPAMDMRLYLSAAADGKRTGGLETIAEQTGVFESFTLEENLQMLDITLDYMEKNQRLGRALMEDTYQAYRSGDTEEFSRLMETQMPLPPSLMDKFGRLLISERNQRMAGRIVSLLREKPNDSHFFAVGAAHYSGPRALQKLLRQQGYRVIRVSH